MRHVYSWLDPARLAELLASLDLRKLFNKLLLMAGGDVERALAWLRELKERGFIDGSVDLDAFLAELEDEQSVGRDASGGLALAAGGMRRLRRSAFEEVFGGLRKGGPGQHGVAAAGEGTERLPETRPYEFGDELGNLDAVRSTQNALRRSHGALDLAEDDLEVFETEHNTACATVICLDVSHSMVLYGEDRITPAKTVALALAELIQTKYPNDSVGVLTFGDRAERIDLAGIAAVQAGPYHTNTCEALAVARAMLARKKQPNKRVFLVTDGKPSAITEGGRVYKNPFGLDMKIVTRTLEEADRCRRQGVVITTFMIATDPTLQEFVDTLTRVNRGRAYFASPTNLGEFLLADYIRNRRKRVH